MNRSLQREPNARQLTAAATLRAVLALFLLWGFLTCLNDTLLPELKFVFHLSYGQAVAVPLTFFSTCFLLAGPCARVIRALGYKRSMVAALVLMGAGTAGILCAASVASFVCFLPALALLGAGITLLQVAAGPYVAFLGSPSGAMSRFSLALGFNSLGTMLAPLFGGWLILSRSSPATLATPSGYAAVNATRQLALTHVRSSYFFLSLSLIGLAIVLALLPLPELKHQPATAGSAHDQKVSILRHRPLLFGAITSFLYAGTEVGIGSLLISYLCLPAVGGFLPHRAALLVSFFWGGATAGRLFGWVLLRRFPPARLLLLCGGGGFLLVLLSVLTTGSLAVACILTVGLCNALIVPIVFLLSVSGLGERTAEASSVMVASNIGAGLTSLAMGLLADKVGLHRAFLLPCVGYAFVVFYAVRGSRGHFLAVGDRPA